MMNRGRISSVKKVMMSFDWTSDMNWSLLSRLLQYTNFYWDNQREMWKKAVKSPFMFIYPSSCVGYANMAHASVYLGHTVYEKAIMTDAKGMTELSWSFSFRWGVCPHSGGPLTVVVGPMNLWSTSSKHVMACCTLNMSKQSIVCFSVAPFYMYKPIDMHAISMSFWCINVLTSPPQVSTENKRAQDLKKWAVGDGVLVGAVCACVHGCACEWVAQLCYAVWSVQHRNVNCKPTVWIN